MTCQIWLITFSLMIDWMIEYLVIVAIFPTKVLGPCNQLPLTLELSIIGFPSHPRLTPLYIKPPSWFLISFSTSFEPPPSAGAPLTPGVPVNASTSWPWAAKIRSDSFRASYPFLEIGKLVEETFIFRSWTSDDPIQNSPGIKNFLLIDISQKKK